MLNDYLYHKTNYGELYCGNCIEIMQYINDDSIPCRGIRFVKGRFL